jgi:hypothetical protein
VKWPAKGSPITKCSPTRPSAEGIPKPAPPPRPASASAALAESNLWQRSPHNARRVNGGLDQIRLRAFGRPSCCRAADEPAPQRRDAVGRAPTPPSGRVRPERTAHASTAATASRRRVQGLFRARTSARSARSFALHRSRRFGHDDRGHAVRASVVPVCVGAFGLAVSRRRGGR